MKLRNKKTGEIMDDAQYRNYSLSDGFGFRMNGKEWEYSSLAELNEEWEDYKEPEDYWYICSTRNYEITRVVLDEGTDLDRVKMDKEIGNYFETPEEAEKAVEKLKAWKRLKDNGFKIKGWKFTPDMKQIEGNYVKIEAEIPQILINEKDLDLLFGGEE